ncbi:unnamed protein product, partial [Musa textilis]
PQTQLETHQSPDLYKPPKSLVEGTPFFSGDYPLTSLFSGVEADLGVGGVGRSIL